MNSNQNSTALNLETLSKQYDAVLREYTQTQTDYINYISSLPCKNPSCATLSTLPGYSFYGTKTLQTTNETSINDCVALCPSISGCSGGTFNSSSKNCQLVSGSAALNASTETDTAIISEDKIYLQKLASLNSMLTNINNQILTAITSGQDEYETQDNTRLIQTKALQQNSSSLYDQKAEIEQKLRELQELNNEQTITTARTTSFYYSYILFIFFVINAIFILISMTAGKETMFAETFRRNLFILIFLEFLFFFLFVQTSLSLVFLVLYIIIILIMRLREQKK